MIHHAELVIGVRLPWPIGLERAGFSAETIAALKRVYRLFFNSELNFSQAIDRARSELPPLPEVERFLEFVSSSQRGVPA